MDPSRRRIVVHPKNAALYCLPLLVLAARIPATCGKQQHADSFQARLLRSFTWPSWSSVTEIDSLGSSTVEASTPGPHATAAADMGFQGDGILSPRGLSRSLQRFEAGIKDDKDSDGGNDVEQFMAMVLASQAQEVGKSAEYFLSLSDH